MASGINTSTSYIGGSYFETTGSTSFTSPVTAVASAAIAATARAVDSTTPPKLTLAKVFNDIGFLKFRVAGNPDGTLFFITTTGMSTLSELRRAMIQAIATNHTPTAKILIENLTHHDDLSEVEDMPFDMFFFRYGDVDHIEVKDENADLFIERLRYYPNDARYDNHPSFFVKGLVPDKYVPPLIKR